MDISEMFSDSYISHPFSNFNRIVILGILFCTGVFLIIPAIFAGGYLFRIIENTIKGDYELPPFQNWKKMFFDGLKVAVVIIFYALPGLVTEFLLILFIKSNSPSIFNSWISIGLLAISLLFYILAYILSITAMPRMACKGQLKAALEVKKVIEDIKIIGIKKYALSLAGFTIMAVYLTLFAGYLHELFYYIGTITYLNVYIADSIANLMVYPLLIASQGRLMGLIYLERVQSSN